MPGFLTSSSLIATIKREGMIPTSQSTFTDDDFLQMANQEMRIGIVPSIMQYHEEYYVRDSAPVPVQTNKSSYDIPYRAVGGKLRDVFFQDEQGNLRKMTRIHPDDRPYYQESNFQNRFIYFYLQGNQVVLSPPVGVNPFGSLLFSYYLRPNELVDEKNAAIISAIAVDPVTGTTTYSVDKIPKGFATNTLFDLLQTNPGHKTYSFDLTASVVDAVNLSVTFQTTDVDPYVVVGDYICFAGQCIIPQCPSDLQDVLSQRVVMRCLQALGDQAGYGVAQSKLTEMEKYTGNLVDNRSEGNPLKVMNNNSLIRNAKMSRRGFW